MTKNRHDRHLHLLAPIGGLPEHWSLRNRQPHVEAKKHQHCTRQKWKAPAEHEELLICEPSGKEQEDAAREEESNRRSELREHAIPGALVRRRILDGKEYGAPPLATETKSLSKAA